MGAKNDIEERVTAQLNTSTDDVLVACQRAAATLGKRAKLSTDGAKILVHIHTNPITGPNASIVVRITATTNREAGSVHVSTAVVSYRTTQPKMIGFIPAGPKHLIGRNQYFKFLDALETELRSLDPAGGHVSRLNAGR